MPSQPIEVFSPPNMLKAKLGGGGMPALDVAAIERAEAALGELKSEFAGWAADDVKKLMAAREKYASAPTAAHRQALMRAAHDLKGQAATFDFPLIARVAGSLAKLLQELPRDRDVPPGLVDGHVSAIHVIHRDNIQDMSDKMTVVLISELEKQVGSLVE